MKHRFWITLLLLLSVIITEGQNRIVVSKDKFELYVLSEVGDTLFIQQICCGSAFGNKEKDGDMKTPEGEFVVSAIINSKKWTHDFKDGFGKRKGAYGPWFIRLKTPKFTGIGIHGTCFPESMGTRQSEGCIRLRNEDLEALYNYIFIGMKVEIQPDIYSLPKSDVFPDFTHQRENQYFRYHGGEDNSNNEIIESKKTIQL